MNTTQGNLSCMLAAAALASATVAASASAATRTPKDPPCTRTALRAGLGRGTAQPKDAKFQGSFGCAGGWAYSGVQVGGAAHGFDAIAVYRAERGRWVAVDRATPCRTHAIPRKIYARACTTS